MTFELPAGTVTFLLSDIEGSTRLWESDPEAMARAVATHYALLSDAVGRHGGVRPVEQGEGDSVVAPRTPPPRCRPHPAQPVAPPRDGRPHRTATRSE